MKNEKRTSNPKLTTGESRRRPRTFVVTVFGSSRPKKGEPEYATAYQVGKLLAKSGFVVCNGGYGGVMEASARGAKESGGKTIGVVTRFFSTRANTYIDKKIMTGTHIDRLMKLIKLGDAYVILRGGTGTLVELATVWEYMNKHVVDVKPIIVVGKFWSPVVQTLAEELAFEGKGDATKYVTVVSSAQECVKALNGRFKL